MLFLASLASSFTALGQPPPAPPLSIGAFLTLGLENHDIPNQPSPVSIPVVGIYGEWTRHRIHPGLDLRAEGGTEGIQGTLVGPRVSTSIYGFHPYLEGLFGPNHLATSNLTQPATDHEGVTKEVAFGLDVGLHGNFRWRLVEFTFGSFSGVHGSTPHAITSGVVMHFP